MSNQMPPFSTRCERVVLCGIMHDPPVMFGILTEMKFSSDHLYWHAHRIVYQTYYQGFIEYEETSLAWLYQRMRRESTLKELGPCPGLWIAECFTQEMWFSFDVFEWWPDDMDIPENGGEHSITTCLATAAARKVKWLAERRNLIHNANEVIRDALVPTDGPDNIERHYLKLYPEE